MKCLHAFRWKSDKVEEVIFFSFIPEFKQCLFNLLWTDVNFVWFIILLNSSHYSEGLKHELPLRAHKLIELFLEPLNILVVYP